VGVLRRETTLFVVPPLEGFTTAQSFHPGTTYIVILQTPVVTLEKQDVEHSALPAGTLGVFFNCGGPLPLAQASKDFLKRLGPGRLPDD